VNAGERYEELVEQVAATGRIWLLEDEAGLVGSVDEEGQQYLAIWPDLESAEACAVGPWKEASPTPMDVRAALPAIVERQGLLAAHPTPEDEGFLVAAADFELRLVD
jgi:hypothetical protein